MNSKAIIYSGELDYISKCVLDYPQIETGGDLFGFWTHSGFPVIQYVIGPGRNAKHQVAFFNQDIEYLISIGTLLREKHALQHIGEWHSHHQLGLAEPSAHDITTVANAISNYRLNNFFLVITNISISSTSINGFMFQAEMGRSYTNTGWVILDGQSPIRKSFDSEHSGLVYNPKIKHPSISKLVTATLGAIEIKKPTYTPEHWLLEKNNHLLLYNILQSFNQNYKDVELYQDNRDLTINITFSHAEARYNICFPNDFPIGKPTAKGISGCLDVKLPTNEYKYDSTLEIQMSVLMYVDKLIKIGAGTGNDN